MIGQTQFLGINMTKEEEIALAWEEFKKEVQPFAWMDQVREQKRLLQNNKCLYCSCELKKGDPFLRPTLDHVIPVSRGGTDTEFNLVVCCNTCNTLKGHSSFESFYFHLKPAFRSPPSQRNHFLAWSKKRNKDFAKRQQEENDERNHSKA